MNRTRFLIVLLVTVISLQIFPGKAGVIELAAVGAVALYASISALAAFRARHRKRSAQAVLEAADNEEYQRYKLELDAIRARHDPDRDLSDPTSIAQEYKDELTALHDKHKAMLDRKFGPR